MKTWNRKKRDKKQVKLEDASLCVNLKEDAKIEVKAEDKGVIEEEQVQALGLDSQIIMLTSVTSENHTYTLHMTLTVYRWK